MLNFLRMTLLRSATLAFLVLFPYSQSLAVENLPVDPNGSNAPSATDTTQPGQSEEFKPLTGLDNTPKGGTLPGGPLPGGTLRGGTLPGGTVPGGTLPGGSLPGGTLEGGSL